MFVIHNAGHLQYSILRLNKGLNTVMCIDLLHTLQLHSDLQWCTLYFTAIFRVHVSVEIECSVNYQEMYLQ